MRKFFVFQWEALLENSLPTVSADANENVTPVLRNGAKEMLQRLEENGQQFCFVSSKPREQMLKEVGRLGVAALARAYFSPFAGDFKTKHEMLIKIQDIFGDDKQFVLVAEAQYEKNANMLSHWQFAEANEKSFETL